MLGRFRRAEKRNKAKYKRSHADDAPEVLKHRWWNPYKRGWEYVYVLADAEFCAAHGKVWKRVVDREDCSICRGEFVEVKDAH